MYEVVFKDGRKEKMIITAESILDGHYQIYRKFGQKYLRIKYVK